MITQVYSTVSTSWRQIYLLDKACVELARNVDSFQAGQEMLRSAHPILWIYLDFSTVELARISKVRLKNGLARSLAAWRRSRRALRRDAHLGLETSRSV